MGYFRDKGMRPLANRIANRQQQQTISSSHFPQASMREQAQRELSASSDVKRSALVKPQEQQSSQPVASNRSAERQAQALSSSQSQSATRQRGYDTINYYPAGGGVAQNRYLREVDGQLQEYRRATDGNRAWQAVPQKEIKLYYYSAGSLYDQQGKLIGDFGINSQAGSAELSGRQFLETFGTLQTRDGRRLDYHGRTMTLGGQSALIKLGPPPGTVPVFTPSTKNILVDTQGGQAFRQINNDRAYTVQWLSPEKAAQQTDTTLNLTADSELIRAAKPGKDGWHYTVDQDGVGLRFKHGSEGTVFERRIHFTLNWRDQSSLTYAKVGWTVDPTISYQDQVEVEPVSPSDANSPFGRQYSAPPTSGRIAAGTQEELAPPRLESVEIKVEKEKTGREASEKLPEPGPIITEAPIDRSDRVRVITAPSLPQPPQPSERVQLQPSGRRIPEIEISLEPIPAPLPPQQEIAEKPKEQPTQLTDKIEISRQIPATVLPSSERAVPPASEPVPATAQRAARGERNRIEIPLQEARLERRPLQDLPQPEVIPAELEVASLKKEDNQLETVSKKEEMERIATIFRQRLFLETSWCLEILGQIQTAAAQGKRSSPAIQRQIADSIYHDGIEDLRSRTQSLQVDMQSEPGYKEHDKVNFERATYLSALMAEAITPFKNSVDHLDFDNLDQQAQELYYQTLLLKEELERDRQLGTATDSTEQIKENFKDNGYYRKILEILSE